MKILNPEWTRRALWFMYNRLTSSPLHTAYTLCLLVTSLTLASLHLASLTATHSSLSKLSTLLALARPENSSLLIPTFSTRDGQPVLQLCNIGQSDCQVISSVAPSATASNTPEPPPQPSSGTLAPATTAQESNARATQVPGVGVQGNGVVSASASGSSSSSSVIPTSTAVGVLNVVSSASVSPVSSISSTTGIVIAEIPESTVGKASESSSLAAPTLVLLAPLLTTSTSTTTKSTSATASSSDVESTSTSELVEITTTTSVEATSTESLTTSSETSTQATLTEELTTSTTSVAQASTTEAETTTSTSTRVSADATAVEISTSTLASQSVPTLPSIETTTISSSSSPSSSSSAQETASAGVSIQVIATETPSVLQLPRRRSLRRRAFSASPVVDGNGTLSRIDVTDVNDNGSTEVTRLGVVCALAMSFPELQLRQCWMEDFILVVFYLWLAGIGIAAITNESTSHLISVFLSSLFALLWSGTQLSRTRSVQSQFDAFITRGACSGVDVLPFYWAQRTRLEVPMLIINILTVLLLGGISLRLAKVYQKTEVVNRYLYKIILILRIAILMGMFFLGAATVLWVQQLFAPTAGAFGVTTTLGALKVLGVISLVLAVPLGAMGWWALGVETRGSHARARWAMGFFLVLDLVFVAQWTATFASDLYREAFTRWTIFAALSIGGFFLLVGSLGTGVICWMRFGRVWVSSIPIFTEKAAASESGHGRGHSNSTQPDKPWDYPSTAEKAWEPFEPLTVHRQSQFTFSESDRQSTAFSYGLRSPAPPMPPSSLGDSRSGSIVSLAV